MHTRVQKGKMSTIDFVISNQKNQASLQVLRNGNSSDHLPIHISIDKFYSTKKKIILTRTFNNPYVYQRTNSLYNLINEVKEGDELVELEKFV
jgi:hypothetical protein